MKQLVLLVLSVFALVTESQYNPCRIRWNYGSQRVCLDTNAVNYFTARANCKGVGMKLFEPNDSVLQGALSTMYGQYLRQTLWIGIDDKWGRLLWGCLGIQVSGYTNWASERLKQGNTQSSRCVVANANNDWKWESKSCYDEYHPYLCIDTWYCSN